MWGQDRTLSHAEINFENGDMIGFHFTQNQQLLNKCSKVSLSSTGSFLFINLISTALWLTLSKALDKSTAHIG